MYADAIVAGSPADLLADCGQVDAVSWTPPAHMTFETWADIGAKFQQIDGSLNWWLGDWLNEGEKRYGETYAQAIEVTGHKTDQLTMCKWVAANVRISTRVEILSWTHHRYVAHLPEIEQTMWLSHAAEHRLSSRQLKQSMELASAQRPTPPKIELNWVAEEEEQKTLPPPPTVAANVATKIEKWGLTSAEWAKCPDQYVGFCSADCQRLRVMEKGDPTLYGVRGVYICTGCDYAFPPGDSLDDYNFDQGKAAEAEARKEERLKRKVEIAQTLPPGLYNVWYADPAWEYENTEADGAAAKHYDTMPLEDIKALPQTIGLQAAPNAVLFLWATNPLLESAFEVIKAWGFTYKSNIVWIKTDLVKPGTGHYVRGRHELLLIATRGSFTPLDPHLAPPIGSVLTAPLREHSRKPDEAYDIIERLYPGCNYVELFARTQRPGWVSWGNQVDKFGEEEE